MWAIMRLVVVFPFVPVTAMIGIRLGDPGGNRLSTTGTVYPIHAGSVWLATRVRNDGANEEPAGCDATSP